MSKDATIDSSTHNLRGTLEPYKRKLRSNKNEDTHNSPEHQKSILITDTPAKTCSI